MQRDQTRRLTRRRLIRIQTGILIDPRGDPDGDPKVFTNSRQQGCMAHAGVGRQRACGWVCGTNVGQTDVRSW